MLTRHQTDAITMDGPKGRVRPKLTIDRLLSSERRKTNRFFPGDRSSNEIWIGGRVYIYGWGTGWRFIGSGIDRRGERSIEVGKR